MSVECVNRGVLGGTLSRQTQLSRGKGVVRGGLRGG